MVFAFLLIFTLTSFPQHLVRKSSHAIEYNDMGTAHSPEIYRGAMSYHMSGERELSMQFVGCLCPFAPEDTFTSLVTCFAQMSCYEKF